MEDFTAPLWIILGQIQACKKKKRTLERIFMQMYVMARPPPPSWVMSTLHQTSVPTFHHRLLSNAPLCHRLPSSNGILAFTDRLSHSSPMWICQCNVSQSMLRFLPQPRWPKFRLLALSGSSSSCASTLIINRSPQSEIGEPIEGVTQSDRKSWQPCQRCGSEFRKLEQEKKKMEDILYSISKSIMLTVLWLVVPCDNQGLHCHEELYINTSFVLFVFRARRHQSRSRIS